MYCNHKVMRFIPINMYILYTYIDLFFAKKKKKNKEILCLILYKIL